MAAISQTIFSDAFFVNENLCILIKILLKFVPKRPIVMFYHVLNINSLIFAIGNFINSNTAEIVYLIWKTSWYVLGPTDWSTEVLFPWCLAIANKN